MTDHPTPLPDTEPAPPMLDESSKRFVDALSTLVNATQRPVLDRNELEDAAAEVLLASSEKALAQAHTIASIKARVVELRVTLGAKDDETANEAALRIMRERNALLEGLDTLAEALDEKEEARR